MEMELNEALEKLSNAGLIAEKAEQLAEGVDEILAGLHGGTTVKTKAARQALASYLSEMLGTSVTVYNGGLSVHKHHAYTNAVTRTDNEQRTIVDVDGEKYVVEDINGLYWSIKNGRTFQEMLKNGSIVQYGSVAVAESAGLVSERYSWRGAPTTRYGNSTGHAAYTYRKPTKDRKYIKILQCLLDGEKTKAEVHAEIGLPDPTVKDERGNANNYYSSVWQELRHAGLVDFERRDGKTFWFITERGMELVDEANGV